MYLAIAIIIVVIILFLSFVLSYKVDTSENKKFKKIIRWTKEKRVKRTGTIFSAFVLLIGAVLQVYSMILPLESPDTPLEPDPVSESNSESDPEEPPEDLDEPNTDKSLLNLQGKSTQYVLFHADDSEIEDIFGNIFTGGSIEMQCGYSPHHPEITYRLNGKYSSLELLVSQTKNISVVEGELPNTIYDSKLIFIGDGERLWIKVNGEEKVSLPLTENYTEPVAIEVSLKGIKELKIVKPIDYMKHMNNILLADTKLSQTNQDYNFTQYDKLKDKQIEVRKYNDVDLAKHGWKDYVTLSTDAYWYDSLVLRSRSGEYDFNLNGEYKMLKTFVFYQKRYDNNYDDGAEVTFIYYDIDGKEIERQTVVPDENRILSYEKPISGIYKMTILSEGYHEAVLVEPRLVKPGEPLYLPPA